MSSKQILFAVLVILTIVPLRADWQPPIPVIVSATVTKGSIIEGLKVPGSFVAVEDVTIRAKTEGEILEVAFEDGKRVQKGDTLFRINDKEKKALLQKAEADVKLSSAQLRRARELKSRGFLSQSELDKLEAENAQAKAQKAIAQEGLSKTNVTAPFDGVLSSREVSAGAYVKNYDSLVRLQTLSPVRFEFQIPTKQLDLVKEKEDVTVSTDAFPGQLFKGQIVVVEPRADEKTRNVKVTAEFANTKGELLPGMFGTIAINTSGVHEAILIPEEALVVRRDGLYVYRIDKPKSDQGQEKSKQDIESRGDKTDSTHPKAKLVKINVGMRADNKVEVLSGLSEGEEVVLQGQDKIHDSADIEIYKP